MKWVPVAPDERALQSLKSGLGLVERGCVKDFVTGLIDRCQWGVPDEGRYLTASHFAANTSPSPIPSHRVAEARCRTKHGTYSRRPGFFTPDDQGVSMEHLIRRLFSPHPVSLNGRAMGVADEKVRKLIPSHEGLLNLCSLRTAVDSFEGKTGLGWPVFSSDRGYIPVSRDLSASLIRCHYPHESVHLYPGVVGFRGQPRGPGMFCKFRAIFQCSRVIMNLEKMLQIPLHAALRKHECFCAWNGRDAVDIAVTRLMRSSKHPIVSVDFSNFDASIPSEVIKRVFGIIRGWFHRSWHPHIEYLQKVFCGCGIIIPHREKQWEILGGEFRGGGVPSGSVLTNLIDSLVNLWVVTYAAACDGGVVTHAIPQGDDGVFRFVGTTAEKVSKRLLSDLGMVLSVEKSLVSSSEVHFLQNVHHKEYDINGVLVGVRPLMRVLNGMMSYEDINRRWEDKELFDGFRWLQQLQNASAHPSFESACEWLYNRAEPSVNRVLECVLSGNTALLSRVKSALSGKYEWGKVAIDGLGATAVFQTMVSIAAKRRRVS